ncbi:MAG: DUF2161 family putative PD-(D/E)XK-type phosphodiesterase [Candidatus Hydrogenedentales bacterium]|jgi:hypothetical protein
MGKAKASFLEVDLYAPLRDYLEAQGYTVRSEVNGCDVVAVKGDDLIVVELKRAFGIALLVQAAERQRISDSVYVAIPRPDSSLASKRWKGTRHLLRRLELGLILIAPRSRARKVEIVFHPTPFDRKKRSQKRRAVLKEVAGRSGDYNQGGSTRRKLMTAYRESAIRIAVCLDRFGPMTPKGLRALGAGPKTTGILYDNVYGWFERVGRGLYALSAQGKNELGQYQDLVAAFSAELPEKTEEGAEFRD